METMIAEIILVMGLANERWRYIVTPSLIGWAHIQDDHGIVFGEVKKYSTILTARKTRIHNNSTGWQLPSFSTIPVKRAVHIHFISAWRVPFSFAHHNKQNWFYCWSKDVQGLIVYKLNSCGPVTSYRRFWRTMIELMSYCPLSPSHYLSMSPDRP